MAMATTAAGSGTMLPPPKPTRFRIPSSSSSNGVSGAMQPTSKTASPPVPLPRPSVHLPQSQDGKDATPRTNSQGSIEEARIRLRPTGSALGGLSSSTPGPSPANSKAATPPLPPPVATKPIITSSAGNNTQSTPVPPPKPKRTSLQLLHSTPSPPAPNAKPLNLQCNTTNNSSAGPSANHSSSSSVAVSTHHHQQPQGDQQHLRTSAQQHHYQGVKLPIVPRTRKPSHLQQQQQQQQQQQTCRGQESPSSVEGGASAALVQARSRLRSTAQSSSPPSTTQNTTPTPSVTTTPAQTPGQVPASFHATAPKINHVYPPPEQPLLHHDHYHESYLQQQWDLQEDEEDDNLALAEQQRRSGRSKEGGSGAEPERRKILIDTLLPPTPPLGTSLTSAVTDPPSSPSSSSASSLAVSLQKIQSLVHEQTERIRQVNYAEKKADIAEVVYEKSALWRVRGAEWGGLAKKAWGDRGGVGGIAGGLAERWRRRGDYPVGGGYNPEGKTTGHVDQIFGIPLAEAVKHSRISPSTGVPAVVTRCIEYLDVMGVEEVGLYRISGSSTTVARMKALFDQGQDYDFLQKGHEPPNPHDVATLLKLYLRELPAPIIPSDLMPTFTQAASSDDPGPALREQLKQLSLENYLLLATLCQHLSTLADYEAVTKMSMSNLGLIFCPTLQIGSALFKQLLGGDDPARKASGTTMATADGMGTDAEEESHRRDGARWMEEPKEDVECHGQQPPATSDDERRALREFRLGRVWADKETRHEEMENLELVKDFELALEMQQDEEKVLHQQQQKRHHDHHLQRGGSDPSQEQHRHQDHEWDCVDDFDEETVGASNKVDVASSSSLSTSAPSTTAKSPPLIDLYDEMVMREIDEAASTPLITPPQTIRSAPLPYVTKRQPPPPPPPQQQQQQQQQRRRHAREPAAILDNSIGISMGRSLVLESCGQGGNTGDDDEFSYADSKRMSRSFHSGTELQQQQQQLERSHVVAQRRRSRPPPTFLAGVGMALPSSSPPPAASSASVTTGGQASGRLVNGSHLDNSNGGHGYHKHGPSSVASDSNGASNANHSLVRPAQDRNMNGNSPSTSLSSATSAATATAISGAASSAIPSSTTITPSNSATVFQDLFARPAQPTVSREDARGTKIKRIVNPFETMAATANTLPSSVTPQPPVPLGATSTSVTSATTTTSNSHEGLTMPPAASGHVNGYIQQLQLHEEDNIRSTLDSSARHRRQPAGFERGGGVSRGEVK
ncbi:hypothetical protein BGZ73_004137 [Actinomortierella ambigua]|nr:hypothetical protein BGZ73_004137 [Actinomortierella ambigua]